VPHNLTIRQRLRYRFDNLMARGAGAQVGMLALLTLALILVAAGGLRLANAAPDPAHKWSFGRLVWESLMRAMDAGNVMNDTFQNDAIRWGWVLSMMVVTLGGIFIVASLIGIINNRLGDLLESLRRGKSLVAERGHTVILGFTPKVHTLLSELAEANANQRNACVVILADMDKVAMDEEIKLRLPAKKKRRMKVVTRSGSPISLPDLAIVNLPAAKSVIVTSPEHDEEGEPLAPHESDTVVLKTLLAIHKDPTHSGDFHVVAELQDQKILDVARMVTGDTAALLLGPPLISRLLVQTGRQSGLSIVFTELLDFGGSEIYIQPQAELVGRPFREALFRYDDSTLIGLLTAKDELMLPPKLDYVMQAGDQVIAISEDDDTVLVNGRADVKPDDAAIIRNAPQRLKGPERTLVLGTSERLLLVLRELAQYVDEGSETVVVGEDEDVADRLAAAGRELPHMKIVFHPGDISDRATLDRLDVGAFDHILVLSESAGRSIEVADARTMVTLLHLRDLMRKSGKVAPVTSEILDIGNRELAAVAEADDFIVSNTLVALMVSQLSENRHLVRVFEELFTPGGHEIYLRPVSEYVKAGVEVDFYTVTEAAARRNDIALGYRLAAHARDGARGYGVVVNPKKHAKITFAPEDQLVVYADADPIVVAEAVA
jgi:hypothetical protein